MNTQEKIDYLIEVISASGIRPKAKKFALNIISELVADINIKDNLIKKYRANANRINPDIIEEQIVLSFALNRMLGIGEIDMFNMNIDNFSFISANLKKIGSIDSKKITTICKSYNLFVTLNNKPPDNIEQLRTFISELNA